jgi:hypothetical protein
MLVAQAAVALVLMIALAVPPRGAATHRGRLLRAQGRWAEEMDRH